MSATSRGMRRARPDDPRVRRTTAAARDAARALFLRRGYARTSMDDIAAHAGIAKRTLYNNHADKDALFTQTVSEVIDYAEAFARTLPEALGPRVTAATLRPALHALGRRLAVAIVRPEVIALRRLLVGESREFPALAADYFTRAPGQVLAALAAGFARLSRRRLLRAGDGRVAAAQFAYLVAGEPLDRAMLTGVVPREARLAAGAREGVETFLARWARG